MAITRVPTAQQQDARRAASGRGGSFRFGKAPTLNTDPGINRAAARTTKLYHDQGEKDLQIMKQLAKARTSNAIKREMDEALRPLLNAEGANVIKAWPKAEEAFRTKLEDIREKYRGEEFGDILEPVYEDAMGRFMATGKMHEQRELDKVAKAEAKQDLANTQNDAIKHIIRDKSYGAAAFVEGILEGTGGIEGTGDSMVNALDLFANLHGMSSDTDEGQIKIEGEDAGVQEGSQRDQLVGQFISSTLVESIQGLATQGNPGDVEEAEAIFNEQKEYIDPEHYPRIQRLLQTAKESEEQNNALYWAVRLYEQKDPKKRQEQMVAAADGNHKMFSLMNSLVNKMDQNEERAKNKAIQQFDTAVVMDMEKNYGEDVPFIQAKEKLEQFLKQGLANDKLTRSHANGLRSYLNTIYKEDPPVTDSGFYRQLIDEYRTNRQAFATRNLFNPAALKKLSKNARSFFTSLQRNELGDLTRGFDASDRTRIQNLLLDSSLDENEIFETFDDLAQLRRKGEDRDPKAREMFLQQLQEKERLMEASQAGFFRSIGEGIGLLTDMAPQRELYASTARDMNLFASPEEALSKAASLDPKYPARQTADQTYSIVAKEMGPLTEKNYQPFMKRWTDLYRVMRRRQLMGE